MSQNSSSKRSFRKLVFACAIVIAGALVFVSGWNRRLDIEYALMSKLSEYATVRELIIPTSPPLKMFLNPKDHVITYRMMASGDWEPNESYWTTELLRKGDTYVDIGANVGYYTLLASRRGGEEGHVFAFEPDPDNFRILERNVRLNNLQNVTLVQKAVSNENATIRLFIAEDNKGDHRIYQTEEERPSVEVEAVTLDDFFFDYDRSIDFVKIDTQGAEGVIVDGMRGIIENNDHIVIAIEYFPKGLKGLGTDVKNFVKDLRAMDFIFFNLGPGHPWVFPIKDDLSEKDLNKRYTINNGAFTNLLMVKGLEELRRKQMILLQAREELESLGYYDAS